MPADPLRGPTARRLLPLTACALIAGLLLAACGDRDDGGAPRAAVPPITAPTPTERAEPAAAAAATVEAGGGTVEQAALLAVIDAWAGVRNYRIDAEISSAQAGGGPVALSMEVVRPDRQRLVLATAGQTLEWIIIGDTGYARVGGGWTEMPALGSMSQLPVDPKRFLDQIDDLTMPEYAIAEVGEETIDGVDCVIWEVTSPGEKAVSRIWIGKDDNLPRRVEAESEAGAVTLTVSSINGDITIEPPI